MAITLENFGKAISTEKYLIRATTDNASCTSIIMEITVDGVSDYAKIEQDPNVDNPLAFDFEISDIMKNVFDFQFRDLSTTDSFSSEVGYAIVNFREVEGTFINSVFNFGYYKIKNITQDVFAIEEFDLDDYRAGNSGSSDTKLLTSAPLTKCLAEGESEFLAVSSWDYTVTGGAVFEAQIDTASGIPINVDTTFTVQFTKGAIVENYTVFIPAGADWQVYNMIFSADLVTQINTTSAILTAFPSPICSAVLNICGAVVFGQSDGEITTVINANTAINVNNSGSSGTPTGISAQHWVVESYNAINTLLGTVNYDLDNQIIAGFPPPTTYPTNDNSVIRLTMENGIAYKKAYIADISGGVQRSEIRTFENCGKCDGVRLHWENEFGEQDSFTFNGRVIKNLVSEFDSFQKVRPVAPLSSEVGELVYKSKYGQEWAIFTRVVSPRTLEWLSNSIKNNRAAIEVNGKYYPIVIKDTRVVTNDNLNPQFQFSLNFEFANKRKGVQ